jgi:hypothetical protein
MRSVDADLAGPGRVRDRVAAAGDIACPPGQRVTAVTCHQGATARLVKHLNPTWVLALGDLQYESGGWGDSENSYDKSWGTFRSKSKASGRQPRVQDFRGKRLLQVLQPQGARLLRHQHRHLAHLRAQLQLRSDRLCQGENPAGHDHDCERFAPMDGHGNLKRKGILSFVVGTGGKLMYHRGPAAPGTRYFRHNKFGVLMLSLGKGAFSWNFRTIGGAIRDTGSRTCR